MQPPHIHLLVEELQSRMEMALAEELVGLYVFGSLVAGDFDPDVSDIDLLAVTAGDLNTSRLRSLQCLHDDFAAGHEEWRNRIEVLYVPQSVLRSFRSRPGTIAKIGPGEPLHTTRAGVPWLVNWYLIRAQGVALLGPEPSAFIPPISTEEFIDGVREQLRHLLQSLSLFRHVGGQAYVVLTMCRGMYTCLNRTPISKKAAARWASDTFPEWRTVIENAGAWRDRRIAQGVDPDAHYPRTEDFATFAVGQLRAR